MTILVSRVVADNNLLRIRILFAQFTIVAPFWHGVCFCKYLSSVNFHLYT